MSCFAKNEALCFFWAGRGVCKRPDNHKIQIQEMLNIVASITCLFCTDFDVLLPLAK